MLVAIYGIGGLYNEVFVGIAHDPVTALHLVALIRLGGGRACSVHGPRFKHDPAQLSGELSLVAAEELFRAIQDDWAEAEMTDIARPW